MRGGSPEAARELGRLQAELARLSAADSYQRLGLTEDADASAVRSAFLKLVKEYHPHRFSRYGAELEKIANEVFLVIKSAYDHIAEATSAEPSTEARGKSSLRPPPRRRRRTSAPAPPGSRLRPNSVRFKPVSPGEVDAATADKTNKAEKAEKAEKKPPVRPLKASRPRRRDAKRDPAAAAAPVPKPPSALRDLGSSLPSDASSIDAGGTELPPAHDHSGLRARLASEEEARLTEYRAASKLLNDGKPAKAREAFKKLAVANPSEKRYRVYMHYAWGREHQLSGNYPSAEAEYRRALKINDRFSPAAEALAALPRPSEDSGSGGVFGRLFRRGAKS